MCRCELVASTESGGFDTRLNVYEALYSNSSTAAGERLGRAMQDGGQGKGGVSSCISRGRAHEKAHEQLNMR